MSAHTAPTTAIAFRNSHGGFKQAVLDITLSASYDAGGSTIDLSTAGNLGAALGFTTVVGCEMIAVDVAGSSKYFCAFIPGSSNSPSTGKIKIHDSSQAADAEASGNLSTVVLRFLVTGT